MRKTKPREKREIKINEPKEIKITRKPKESELNITILAAIIKNIAIVVDRHRQVWQNEEDGWLNQYYKILIGRVINLATEIYDNYLSDRPIDTDNKYHVNAIIGEILECREAFRKTFKLSQNDIDQRLPAGFCGTYIAWSKMLLKITKDKKLQKISRDLGFEKRLWELAIVSAKYFEMVQRDIFIKEVA